VALPRFAIEVLERRRSDESNPLDAVFVTRKGTWYQVNNVERRWREIRTGTELEWVAPHHFRKTVATLISARVDSETASQQLGPSSSAITREYHIAKPALAADVADLLRN
jgi:integrase